MEPHVIPPMRKHQVEALQFIEDKDVFALFMEMGTGKTKVIIEKTAMLYRKGLIDCILVIAPNAVKPQWPKEQFPTHYPNKEWNGYIWDGASTNKSSTAFHKGLNDKTRLFVMSTNVEAYQWDTIDIYIKAVLAERRVFVVVDESVKIKNGRRKPKKGKRAGAKRTNKIIDLFKNVKYKAILTGTPTPKSPFDLWAQFEFLQQDYFGRDYFYFTHHYGIIVNKKTGEGKSYSTTLDEPTFTRIKSWLKKAEAEEDGITPRTIENISISLGLSTKDVITIKNMKEYSAYKNLDELKSLVGRITFYKDKKDCLDLPEKLYEKLYCEMSGEQKRVYKDLKKKMYTEYLSQELTVTTKMALLMRLQMVTGGLFPHKDLDSPKDEYTYTRIGESCKVKVLLEDLESVPEDVFIIVWAQFRGEIDILYEELSTAGYTCEKFYGGSSDDVIVRFRNREFRILIGNPTKGGEGLNLQLATLHYYYSNPMRSDIRLQSEDRSHRDGQTNHVLYKDLVCPGTVDERVLQILQNGENLIEFFRADDKFKDVIMYEGDE